uniref:Uncharacterized protein n=1 Tax=Parascaris univalens TaxID=6257 RepID=A0A915A5Z4_PARUN
MYFSHRKKRFIYTIPTYSTCVCIINDCCAHRKIFAVKILTFRNRGQESTFACRELP